MELERILEDFASNLRCSICFEIFTDPATSSCGKHNYCTKCLKAQQTSKVKNCPECRAEFPKDYKPQKNVALCELVNVVSRPIWEEILTRIDLKSTSPSSKNQEFRMTDRDRLEWSVETLKRKLIDLTSEIKKLEDVVLKKLKTKQQSTACASTTKNVIIQAGFERVTEENGGPQYMPCGIAELPQQALDKISTCLRVGQECLSSALCELKQVDVPSQDVDTGQNVSDILPEVEIPTDPGPDDPMHQDAEDTSELTVPASDQPEGPSGASGPQSIAVVPEAGADSAGLSTGLHRLECLSFCPQLGHKDLYFSQDNHRVQVRRSARASPLRNNRFNVSQVMAEQEFSGGVHCWEVNTEHSDGWAVGVAYSSLGCGDQLGRTDSSWCLERSYNKLCFWHNKMSVHLNFDFPSKVRVLLDMEKGSLDFYSMSDRLILLHSIQVQFNAPVRPVFWLYGLKPGNALSITVP